MSADALAPNDPVRRRAPSDAVRAPTRTAEAAERAPLGPTPGRVVPAEGERHEPKVGPTLARDARVPEPTLAVRARTLEPATARGELPLESAGTHAPASRDALASNESSSRERAVSTSPLKGQTQGGTDRGHHVGWLPRLLASIGLRRRPIEPALGCTCVCTCDRTQRAA